MNPIQKKPRQEQEAKEQESALKIITDKVNGVRKKLDLYEVGRSRSTSTPTVFDPSFSPKNGRTFFTPPPVETNTP